MDRAVEAVRTCIVDDVHVGVRFADLLETLSSRIRSSFVRMSSGNCLTGMSTSRAQSRSPGLTAAAMAMAPMGPPPAPAAGGTANNGTLLTAQQPSNWNNRANGNINNGVGNAFNYLSPNSPSITAGRMTPNHPLYGISTEPYDPGTGNVSIMPPPSFSIDGFGTTNNGIYDSSNSASAPGGVGGGSGMNFMGIPGAPDDGIGNANGGGGGGGPDWLALPLDPLLNSYGADVTQTTYGPDVGGCDLLDLLLGNLNNC